MCGIKKNILQLTKGGEGILQIYKLFNLHVKCKRNLFKQTKKTNTFIQTDKTNKYVDTRHYINS